MYVRTQQAAHEYSTNSSNSSSTTPAPETAPAAAPEPAPAPAQTPAFSSSTNRQQQAAAATAAAAAAAAAALNKPRVEREGGAPTRLPTLRQPTCRSPHTDQKNYLLQNPAFSPMHTRLPTRQRFGFQDAPNETGPVRCCGRRHRQQLPYCKLRCP